MNHPAPRTPWWRDAVIYQVYIRSFADGNGDGIGDIAGLRTRLRHLRDLGVDALWINPWYASPQVDAGYDVSDYRQIDPAFGTLTEAEDFLAEAHAHGLRVLVDLVPNHTSDQHRWFRQALAAGPGSAARARYHFHEGRGAHGELPPNNWQSIFGGPAWTRVPDGQWYLHLFASAQPDLNWDHPEVRAEFEDILRFWLDRGADGFRIDVAHGLTKDPALPDLAETDTEMLGSAQAADHPYFDRDATLAIYETWRRITDSYDGERIFVAEAWVSSPERMARYLTPGRLHTAFNFGLLGCPWDAPALRREIDATFTALAATDSPPTWVLSNHDVVRHLTRYARELTSLADAKRAYGQPADLALGLRRARAAALLSLGLPGGAYVYQGEELGLEEVEDLPEEVWQDPSRLWADHTDPVRDGCRVPLPWSGEAAPFGFSPPDAHTAPWLPQPAAWKDRTAEAQLGDPASTLEFYREALRLRRALPDLGEGPMEWLPSDDGVLAFRRGEGVIVVVNTSSRLCALPAHGEVLLSSGPLEGDGLPGDTAVWLAG
ncbi:alpha-glucosidase [Streptomyces spiroverticillatus]|uniref:Alpha-glucosidase n=1 Tax=Streptomyces finlayi TaxID=67296 RepID=A0A918WZX1_9ACTN|nr:glycoside hydrolase family 13 protein [Streptomyces finlayi]GHA17062.1 alpha-glucosidase [Streptomyces spiroverticillatus]GHC99100.1 alpha-glucosidase [Streptomyces finlayi]